MESSDDSTAHGTFMFFPFLWVDITHDHELMPYLFNRNGYMYGFLSLLNDIYLIRCNGILIIDASPTVHPF